MTWDDIRAKMRRHTLTVHNKMQQAEAAASTAENQTDTWPTHHDHLRGVILPALENWQRELYTLRQGIDIAKLNDAQKALQALPNDDRIKRAKAYNRGLRTRILGKRTGQAIRGVFKRGNDQTTNDQTTNDQTTNDDDIL